MPRTVNGTGQASPPRATRDAVDRRRYALKEMDLKHVTLKKAKLLCDAEHACLIHPVVAESPFIVSLTYGFHAACQSARFAAQTRV